MAVSQSGAAEPRWSSRRAAWRASRLVELVDMGVAWEVDIGMTEQGADRFERDVPLWPPRTGCMPQVGQRYSAS